MANTASVIYKAMSGGGKERDAYDKAVAQYEELKNKYQGAAGQNLATKGATSHAQTQAKALTSQAKADATAAARQNNYSKAKATMLGTNAAMQTYQQSYANAYNQRYNAELQKQQADLQAMQQEVANRQANLKEEREERNEAWNKFWSITSFITGIFGISDEKTKNILERWQGA